MDSHSHKSPLRALLHPSPSSPLSAHRAGTSFLATSATPFPPTNGMSVLVVNVHRVRDELGVTVRSFLVGYGLDKRNAGE
jgi:hypothetical protein